MADQIIANQAIVVIIVGGLFFFGVYCRDFFGREPKLTCKELVVTFLAGFIVFGLPLCEPIYCALLKAGSEWINVAISFAPIFLAGLASRSELQKLVARVS